MTEAKPMTTDEYTIVPIAKDYLLSILNGVGGCLRMGVDSEGHAHRLVNELIEKIENYDR